jgi:hypothetical protein
MNTLASTLMAGSAGIILTLGLLHLFYTFRGRKLHPRDDALKERMKEVSPFITRETTMWKTWIGFNASQQVHRIADGVTILPAVFDRRHESSNYGDLNLFRDRLPFSVHPLQLPLISIILLFSNQWEPSCRAGFCCCAGGCFASDSMTSMESTLRYLLPSASRMVPVALTCFAM